MILLTSVIMVTNAQGQSISLSESLVDFGSVEVGNQGQDIVTVTNISSFDIIVSAEIDPSSTSGFSTDWSGFVLLPPGISIDVNVFFDPNSNVEATEVLTIDVLVNDDPPNAPSEEQATVDLIGNGAPDENPGAVIGDIIAFFDAAVASGTLEGTGNYYSHWRVRAMRTRLQAIAFLIRHGYFCHAAYVNATAILRSDGLSCPRDFVQGTDLQAFNDQLELLQLLLE